MERKQTVGLDYCAGLGEFTAAMLKTMYLTAFSELIIKNKFHIGSTNKTLEWAICSLKKIMNQKGYIFNLGY